MSLYNERECNCPAPDGGACRNCIADELHETEISRVAQVDRTWEAQQRAIFAEARNERLVALLRRVARRDETERYPEECEQCDWRTKPCPACRLTLDIRAALHEEGR